MLGSIQTFIADQFRLMLANLLPQCKHFGIKGIQIKNPKDIKKSIQEMLEYDGPVVVDVCVEKLENVYPMIPAGGAHNEMKFSDEDSNIAGTKEGMALV